MSPRTRDRLGSAVFLLFVGSLFVQRDYMTRFGGMFPDLVMAILAIILVATIALSFTSHAAIREPAAEKAPEPPTHLGDMVVVGALLLAWGVLLRPLGFALTGVLGFSAISLYLADRPRRAGAVARSVGIALGVTGILMVVFGRLLQVPLPPGTIFMGWW